MITDRLEVGALLRRHVRVYLTMQQMEGHVDRWVEHQGWLMSTFVIQASEGVWRSLAEWAESMKEVAS